MQHRISSFHVEKTCNSLVYLFSSHLFAFSSSICLLLVCLVATVGLDWVRPICLIVSALALKQTAKLQLCLDAEFRWVSFVHFCVKSWRSLEHVILHNVN